MALIVLLATVGCDQVTKSIASTILRPGEPLSFFGDMIRIHYTQNRGAFLGLGKNLDPHLRFWIFVVGSGAVLLLMALYFLTTTDGRLHELLVCSLILGGGISNLVDRMANDGKVVDFLNLGVGRVRTGIFNLADVAILAGIAGLLLLQSRQSKGRV